MRVKLVGLLAAIFSFMSFAGLSLSAEVQHASDPAAGAAYAKQYCAKCHAINRGETSPGPTAPPFIDVANTKGIRDRFDGMAHDIAPDDAQYRNRSARHG